MASYINQTLGGTLTLLPDDSAVSTTINSGGTLNVYGGTANNTTIKNGGIAVITGNFTPIDGVYYYENGSITNTTISSGGCLSAYGITASSTTILSGGEMVIFGGKESNPTFLEYPPGDPILNNVPSVHYYSASLANLVVSKGGVLRLSPDTGNEMKLSGTVLLGGTMQLNGKVNADTATIALNLNARTTADAYLINNISLLTGASYSITVSADQTAGSYSLAAGASNFNQTITIGNGTTNYGTLTANGNAVNYGSYSYSLVNSSGILSLNIGNAGGSSGGSSAGCVKIYSSGVLVSSGAVITGAALVAGGNNSMFVSASGIANNTIVNSRGFMHVSSGGIANNTSVHAGGEILVSAGGIANGVQADGDVRIYSGGTANDVLINAGLFNCDGMHISRGGTANATILNDGQMLINAGGVANTTTVNLRGYLMVAGVANSTTVDSGSMDILNGGVANNTRVIGKLSELCVSSGGTAIGTIITSEGTMYVYKGATLSDTQLTTSGFLEVFAGGSALDIQHGSEGIFSSLIITRNDTRLITGTNENGSFCLSAGVLSGFALYGTENRNGTPGNRSYIIHRVHDGGIASAVTVHEAASLHISSGGSANGTTVTSTGGLVIYEGGSATNTATKNGGEIHFKIGGSGSNTTINSGYGYISAGGIAETTILNSGSLFMGDGGIANNTTINSGGEQRVGYLYANVIGGGIANNTIINSGGLQRIYSAGVANGVLAHSGGVISALTGATLNGTVTLGGSMQVAGAVTATDADIVFAVNERKTTDSYIISNIGNISGANYSITVSASQEMGSYRLAPGASSFNQTITIGDGSTNYGTLTANGSAVNYASYSYSLLNSGGILSLNISNAAGSSGGNSSGSSGGSSTDYVKIYSGGILTSFGVAMTGVELINRSMHISSGGVANSTTINSGGYQTIFEGGTASNTIINSGGNQIIYSDGLANVATINSGGTLNVYGGTANNMMIKNGGVAVITGDFTPEDGVYYFYNGNIANTTISSGGRLSAYGITASGTTILSGGKMVVSGGGISNPTYLEYPPGDPTLNNVPPTHYYSANLVNLAVYKGGVLTLLPGIANEMKLSGTIVLSGALELSGKVNADTAAITLHLNARTTADTYLINNISLLTGGSYSITVSADQAAGNYSLAGGAGAFAKSIELSVDGTKLGSLSLNSSSLSSGGKNYSLALDGQTLALSVTKNAITTIPNTNLTENGHSQIVAWDAAQGKVGYVAADGQVAPSWRGIWEWSGAEASMWKVVGVGRFSSSVAHDGILLYNGYGNTFAAWTDLGRGDYGYVSLCHVEGNFQTKTLADFDGNGLDDVIIYDEKGSFGIVSDARTYHDVWHVDNAATNVQKLIGAGYFGNADGKSDILVKKTDENAYFLWHNEDPTFNTWNWSQTYIGTLNNDWEVAAIGDFQGDGIDDIIMWQKSTGYMYAWEDGKSSNQRWVGQLDSNKWEIAAVGDYNGDGKEDLLLRELSTGWGGVGYWASANASNWTDLNARIETDMESKFAVIA